MSRAVIANLKFRQEASEGFTTEALSEAIDAGYLSQSREDEFKTKKTFAPSSIGGYNGICARYWKLAFDGADFQDNNDSMGMANMLNGTAAHERLEKVLEDGGVLVDKEIEMRLEDPPVFGYIDVMVKVNGEEAVGEIKTCRPEAFMMRRTSMKPLPQHMYQILLYMKSTGKDIGFLLYENKADQTLLTIPVRMNVRNQKIIDEALDWLRLVRKNWEDGKLPTREVGTRKGKICKYCPLAKTCWEDFGDGDVVIPPMVVATP